MGEMEIDLVSCAKREPKNSPDRLDSLIIKVPQVALCPPLVRKWRWERFHIQM